jgi:hypothetical protein
LKRKDGECAACLKNSVRIFVEKIYKMGCLEGSGVPVLYIGRTVPKGSKKLYHKKQCDYPVEILS